MVGVKAAIQHAPVVGCGTLPDGACACMRRTGICEQGLKVISVTIQTRTDGRPPYTGTAPATHFGAAHGTTAT